MVSKNKNYIIKSMTEEEYRLLKTYKQVKDTYEFLAKKIEELKDKNRNTILEYNGEKICISQEVETTKYDLSKLPNELKKAISQKIKVLRLVFVKEDI